MLRVFRWHLPSRNSFPDQGPYCMRFIDVAYLMESGQVQRTLGIFRSVTTITRLSGSIDGMAENKERV